MVDWDKLSKMDPFSRKMELDRLSKKEKKKEGSSNKNQIGIFRCLKKSKN